jgi:flagellar hook-associated protein 3 FlgL
MRITNSMMTTGVLRDLSWSLRRMQHTQEQLSTGRQLVRASDDPAAAATALALRHQSARAGHFNRSATDAQGWLETADSTLTSALDRLNRAKEITVQASSSGGLSNPSARQGMATEIQAIRADLISLANTKYNGRSLFNGTAVGDAYDAAGQYQGNSAAVLRDVAPQTTMQVNSTGPAIFGTQGGAIGNMFEILDRLSTAITTGNDTAMAAEHTNLDNAMKNLGSATVDLGSRAARLGEIQSRAQDEALRLKSQLSEVEDVDVVDATVRSKEQETAYTAALQVAAKVLPPSLVDYLR